MTISQIKPIEQLLDVLQQKIERHQPENFKIILHRHDYRHVGDWWYIVVHPTQPDVRATEYTRVLEAIEDEIKREEGVNILLVPTIED